MKKTRMMVLLFVVMILFSACGEKPAGETAQTKYKNAVIDAMLAEENEIFDLVCLTNEDEMTTWNDEGQVLLLTWHQYPDSYMEDETTILQYGEVWTFTDKEMTAWYSENKNEIEDINLRLKQLIGLPPDDDKTHFTAMWADPEDVTRPAYYPNAEMNDMEVDDDQMDSEMLAWFHDNIISSYYSDWEYPWTRLGYTYDWSGDGSEYGLSEFLVRKNAEVEVEYTMTTAEFIAYLDGTIVK